MTHRKTNPLPVIIEAVIQNKADDWNNATATVARTDAQRVLEALIAEYGIDAALQALDNQGFTGKSVRYLLTPLHAEATARRAKARAPEDSQGTS